MNKLEKQFRKFLKDNDAQYRSNYEILLKYEKEFNKSMRTMQRWRKNINENKKMTTSIIKTPKKRIVCDGNSCYFCNSKVNLHVHHIDKNPKNNRKPNLVRVCRLCHSRLHSIMHKYEKNIRQTTS